jgi:hypothetical protein
VSAKHCFTAITRNPQVLETINNLSRRNRCPIFGLQTQQMATSRIGCKLPFARAVVQDATAGSHTFSTTSRLTAEQALRRAFSLLSNPRDCTPIGIP